MNTMIDQTNLNDAIEEVFQHSGVSKACAPSGTICINPRCGCFGKQCLLNEQPSRTIEP